MKPLLSFLFVSVIAACAATTARAQTDAAPAVPLGKTKGAKLYAKSCASCHQPDGTGVPDIQPGLVGSTVVAGNPDLVIKLLLRGPAAVLPPPRPQYQSEMPNFASWNDADLAAVTTYIRQKFAAGAASVTPAQVAAVRAAK
jgi:mono/diheme cytochrome c family protein